MPDAGTQRRFTAKYRIIIMLVQGGVLFVAACYVLFNIIVDLAQLWLDPRLGR